MTVRYWVSQATYNWTVDKFSQSIIHQQLRVSEANKVPISNHV